MKHWSEQFLGIPWSTGGRDATRGLDCWGLLRHVYKVVHGLEISEHANSLADHPDVIAAVTACELGSASPWHVTTAPRDGDGVALGRGTTFSHVGVFVEAAEPYVLHTARRGVSVLTPLAELARFGWNNVSFYTHDQRA